MTLTAPQSVERRGLMLVLSSPSGAGKTTISRALLSREDRLVMSISCTTRAPRPGEQDGVDYFFLDREQFAAKEAQGAFLEHAQVFDNLYGTPRDHVEKKLAEGFDVLFDIDWQGTQQLAQNARADLVSVFILPPSRAALHNRLKGRGQDSEEVIARRMAEASAEMSHWAEYDYVLINDDVEHAIGAVAAILRAERLKRVRRIGLADFVNQMRES